MRLNPPHTRLSEANRAVRWQRHANMLVPAMPSLLRRWLCSTDSLTRRLRRVCRHALRVEVLQHGLSRPRLEEAVQLGLPPGRVALVREVRLLDGREAVVEARSVIPLEVLQGSWRILARLGEQPLGEIIFTRPGLSRDRLELCRPLPGGSWGRRNHYRLCRRPLLVAEFFLPELVRRLTGE